MKQAEKARFFDISLTTLANWRRQGAPVHSDVAAIAEWRTTRDLERGGIADSGLPPLVGELTRRRADLDRRIGEVNAWPPGTKAKPNLLKVAAVNSLILEQTILDLPVRLLAAGPSSVPECFFSVVFDALDEAHSEGGST